ncbi:MAG: hypothetical protein ACYTFG_06760, partial [Planctomycetota bacterium]
MKNTPSRLAWIAAFLVTGFAFAQTPGGRSEKPTETAVMGALEGQRVSLNFKDAPFPEVVDQIRRSTGVNIAVDPHVFEMVDPDENLIDLFLENARGLDALDILLEMVDLGRTFRDGVLLVTIPENAIGSPVNVIYDLGGILHQPHWKPGRKFDLTRAYSDPVDPFSPFEGWEELEEQDVLELLHEHVHPESW